MRTLNIGSSAGHKNYVKFSAKTNSWSVRGTDGEDREIQLPTFVADLDNIETGWMRLRKGQAPERVMDPSDREAPKPGDDFKRGFVMTVFSPTFFNGAAEFSSNAVHLSDAVRQVYREYAAAKELNPGKLPVIACTGSQPMKDPHGTNYRPILTIVRWVDRPPELPNVSPVEASEIWQGPTTPPPPEPKLSDPVF